jgi:hypothetical protein
MEGVEGRKGGRKKTRNVDKGYTKEGRKEGNTERRKEIRNDRKGIYKEGRKEGRKDRPSRRPTPTVAIFLTSGQWEQSYKAARK